MVSNFRRNLAALCCMGALMTSCALSATAQQIFVTPGGSMSGGLPVSARATFNFGAGSLTILLENLGVDPTSVAQNLSDMDFTVDSSVVGSTVTGSGTARTVAAGGTYVDSGSVAAGWVFDPVPAGSTAHLTVLTGAGHAGPKHTIIGAPNGSNVYASANGGIAGNGAHNPFLGQSATFVVSNGGFTSSSKVTAMNFSFGTLPDVTIGGDCTHGCGGGGRVPEPGSLALFGGLACSGGLFFRKRR